MNKGVVAGVGLGVVLLAFLGGYWLANNAAVPAADSASAPSPMTTPGTAGGAAPGTLTGGAPGASAPNPAASAAADPARTDAGAPMSAASGASPAVPVQAAKKLTPEERRKLRAAIRAKLDALRAKGQNVTIDEVQAVMDEVERLGQGEFDPRYFKAIRDMLGSSARVQTLSKELQTIASSSNPKDVARRQAILAEMRELSDQISQTTAAVQLYGRPLSATTEKQP